MTNLQVSLFKIFGFEVKMDITWIFIALLITWSLAKGYFPNAYEEYQTVTHWWMGVASMIGLFFSIIFHELSHSLVARRYDLPIKGITLFIFGGVAEMESEPQNAKAEFMMAIAGPIASYALAGAFYMLSVIGQSLDVAGPILGVVIYLAVINLILATFNLVPAFPLDGGRVLRAALWQWSGDLYWATRIASRAGTIFGLFLMVLGVISLMSGNFLPGLWWILIGMFVQGAATAHQFQQHIHQALKGEQVRRFMTSAPITVSPDISVQDLVDDFVYRHHHKLLPVMKNNRLVGCVTTAEIKTIPRDLWTQTSVSGIMLPCTGDNTIDAGEEADKALDRMQRKGFSRLIVTDEGRLAGVIALKDMLEVLALKAELGD